MAFVDDDVVIKSDWVEKITSALSNAHKSLVGVGGIVKAFKNHIISQYYVIHNILEAPIQLNYLPTVNCCFKKEHLMEVGGFDDNFLFAEGEDTDLCLRLKKKGLFIR